MIFNFGKLKINVVPARGVRERERKRSDYIEYLVTVRAPGVPPFRRNTWVGSSQESEERTMGGISIDLMMTLAQAWSRPSFFIWNEGDQAAIFGSPDDVKQAKTKAMNMVRFTNAIDPFMKDAIEALWKLVGRDDELCERGPREWFPGRET